MSYAGNAQAGESREQEGLAERVGFEPTRALALAVFKTAAFSRSATSPHEEFEHSERIPGRAHPAIL